MRYRMLTQVGLVKQGKKKHTLLNHKVTAIVSSFPLRKWSRWQSVDLEKDGD